MRQSRRLKQISGKMARSAVAASHAELGERYLYCERTCPLLFTENETNNERIFGTANASPYVKDGINNYVVQGTQDAVNPEHSGNQGCGALSSSTSEQARQRTIRLRLSDLAPAAMGDPFDELRADHADAPA